MSDEEKNNITMTDTKEQKKDINCEVNSKRKGIKKIIIPIISIIVIAIITVTIVLNFDSIKHMRTERILNKYYKSTLKSQGYTNVKTKVYSEANVDYNGYNKLAVFQLSANQGASIVGIALINTKNKTVAEISTNSNLPYLLDGLYMHNKKDAVDQATKIIARYLEKYGINFFVKTNQSEFKDMIDEIGRIEGIENSRKYIVEAAEKISTYDGENYILFAKGSALIKYVCFYQEIYTFNDKYPFDEKMYKYLYSDYSKRQTLNALEYGYGAPYVYKKMYVVFDDSGEIILKCDSLSEVKYKLNVELSTDTPSTNSSSKNTSSTASNNNTITNATTEGNVSGNATTNDEKAEDDDSYSYNRNNYANNYNRNNQSSYNDSNEENEDNEDNYTSWKMYLDIDEGTIFPYSDDACVVSSGAAKNSDYKYVSYKDNPNSGVVSAEYSQGYELYFNGKKDITYRYEFTNGEELTIKIVAPYLIEKSTGNVIGENVVIYEKTLSSEEWYKKSEFSNPRPYRKVTLGLKSVWDE